MSLQLKLNPLQEKLMLLTTELSFQPLLLPVITALVFTLAGALDSSHGFKFLPSVLHFRPRTLFSFRTYLLAMMLLLLICLVAFLN